MKKIIGKIATAIATVIGVTVFLIFIGTAFAALIHFVMHPIWEIIFSM